VLHGISDRVNEIRRCYGMEVNVKKSKTSRQPSSLLIMIDQKQQKNVKCFKYWEIMVINDAGGTCAVNSRIAMANAVFNIKNSLLARKFVLNLRKNLVKRYIWNIAVNGAETLTLRKADQKYLKSFQTWCWRKIEKGGEGENCE
jgi:hypothetical protein